ncbi:MAG: Arc family DNA-binding protein [candidate division KSB1 bacterium]|nr:Arc family DNA-binding protein [candidate division KSB1 bacterium]
MPILHVRNVPEEIYAELKARAQSEGRSLSAQVILMLGQALRQPARSQSEVLPSSDARRHRFSPRKAGAPSSTELLRQDMNDLEQSILSR